MLVFGTRTFWEEPGGVLFKGDMLQCLDYVSTLNELDYQDLSIREDDGRIVEWIVSPYMDRLY